MRSANRDRASGTLDKAAGRALEMLGRLNGRRSPKTAGKAARGRGAFRRGRARAKGGGRRMR